MANNARPAIDPDPAPSGPGKRRRGRPAATEAEIAERRQKIVQAAYEVFTTKGYHDTAIADIAAHVGTGHGTIYRYFDNKRDLLDHVIDLGLERIMTALSIGDLKRATSTADFRVQVTRLGDSLFTELVDSDPRLPRLLVVEAAAIDTEMLHRLFGMMETVIAGIALALENAQSRGFLAPTLHAESAARSLLGSAITGLLTEARGTGMSVATRRQYIDTVVSMLCDNAPAASGNLDA